MANIKKETKPSEVEIKKEDQKEKLYTYIGPSIDGFLMHNITFRGTKKQIKKQFKDIFEKHSKIEHLFIEVEKLGQTKIEGVLKQYYNQTVKEMRR